MSEKSAKQILIEARELIADESRWAQWEFSYDVEGNEVSPTDKSAVCWCALGAVARILGEADPNGSEEPFYNAVCDRLGKVAEREFGHMPAIVNDESDHATVLRMFDLAIEAAS